jgi:hypothetical protein
MADFGVVNPPAEGCPPRGATGRDRADVERVTEAVMSTLRQRGML